MEKKCIEFKWVENYLLKWALFWHQFKCKLTSCPLSFYWSKMNLNQSKKCRFWKSINQSKTPLVVLVVRVPSQKDNWMIQWGFLRVNFIPKTTVLSSKFIIWDIKYTCASLSKGTFIYYVSKRTGFVGLENGHSCECTVFMTTIVLKGMCYFLCIMGFS